MSRRTSLFTALLSLSILLIACQQAGSPDGPGVPDGRTVVIRSMSGQVEASIAGADFAPVGIDAALHAGDSIQTGPDGEAALRLDDGTLVIVGPDTRLEVSALDGSAETPVTRFFLALGEVFSVRGQPLPEGAAYEIETPSGVAAIRGSSLGVWYDDRTDECAITCLEGRCAAAFGGQTQDLGGGQGIMARGEAFSGGVQPLTSEQLQRWGEVYHTIDAAGEREAVEAACTCEGPDLVCTDGTRVPGFAGCTPPPEDSAAPGEMFCGDAICDDWEAAHPGDCPTDCLPGVVCACEGATLSCEDGTVVENALFCGGPPAGDKPPEGGEIPPGCECVGGDLSCADGSITPTYPGCLAGDLCPDGICDAFEQANPGECPEDCEGK